LTIERDDATVEPDVQSSEHARSIEQELSALHEASFGWALTCCNRDASVAEEVLQDVYFKVLDGRARFDRRSSLRTWLFGVIRMTAREHRRGAVLRFLRGNRGEHEPADLADPRRAPDSEAAAQQRSERMVKALARIAGRQREVLHLVFYEDLSIAEAAQVMGVSIGTARQHYERGKQALSMILREETVP
jgi:RNA polymerase sigma factor (sigma-70 family)